VGIPACFFLIRKKGPPRFIRFPVQIPSAASAIDISIDAKSGNLLQPLFF
jgi:hypothetical protein